MLLDLIFIAFCVYLPVLTVLYLAEVIVILRPHSKFRGPFYGLFVASAFCDIIFIIMSFPEFRWAIYPIANGSGMVADKFALIRLYISFVCPPIQDFLNCFIALNRLTTISIPLKNKPTWNWLLPVSIMFSYVFCMMFFIPVLPRTVYYNAVSMGEYVIYLGGVEIKSFLPWYSAQTFGSVLALIINFITIIIYITAASLLSKVRIKRKEERKLLTIGMAVFVVNIPGIVLQSLMGFNIFPPSIRPLLYYNLAWVADVKCFSVPIINLIVNSSFRRELVKMLRNFMPKLTSTASVSSVHVAQSTNGRRIRIMNNSPWIIFFVKRDALPQPFKENFFMYTVIELVGDFITLWVAAFGAYVFLKVQYFHFNLAALLFNAVTIAFIFMISRYILIPLEFGYLNSDLSNSIIVNVSTFRFMLWIALYHIMILVAIERGLALYYVETYEKVQRRHISLIIIAGNNMISAILSYLVVHKILHGYYYLAFVLIASNVAYLTFLYLNWAGKQRQRELIKQYRGYSVSYRWQLQRNIRAAEELSIQMIIVNVTITIVLPCIFVPAFIMENDPKMSEIYEVSKMLLQVMLSLSFPVVYALFFLAISKHRDYFCGKKAAAESEKIQRGMENVSVDAHVTRLEDAWNAMLDSKIANKN